MRKIFSKSLKKAIKIIIILVLLLASGIILKIKLNSNEQLAVIDSNALDKSSVTIKQGSKTVELDTRDLEAPNNVSDVEIKVLEDNAIINFEPPKDNGTDYEYLIGNGNDTQNLDFHSESGILGYSYKISNDANDTADIKPNKLEDSSILLQDINWGDDYYLHIRTIDNNMNYSENTTIKIDLPSSGVNVEYIEDSTMQVLSAPEKISGMINEDYNASILNKEISGYTLVDTSGDVEGKLKKEAINIKYRYAKNAKLTVRYIDRLTGSELAEAKEIFGYEGKELNLVPLDIKGYVSEDASKAIKMRINEEIVFMYNLEEEKEKIEDTEAKDEETEGIEEEIDKEKESIEEEKDNLINIKYVDIDTDRVLYEEKITRKSNNSSLKIKLKEIEGYRLVNNIEGPDKNNKNSQKPNKESNIKDTTIIDEIIESLKEDEKLEVDYKKDNCLTDLEKNSILAQYEIVMNCDDSDYIIYYKK